MPSEERLTVFLLRNTVTVHFAYPGTAGDALLQNIPCSDTPNNNGNLGDA